MNARMQMHVKYVFMLYLQSYYSYMFMNEISFFIFLGLREQIEALVNDAKLLVEDRTTLQEIIKEKETQVHYVFAPFLAHILHKTS